MISINELKEKSLMRLKGNWANPVVVFLLYNVLSGSIIGLGNTIVAILASIITFSLLILNVNEEIITIVTSFSPIITLIISFVVIPLALGTIIYFLSFAKNEEPKISAIFDGYKNSFWNSILANILISIYTFLWSLLLIIPGIIESIGYSMTFFILAENPKMSASIAITKSQELMKGHKWDYFVLQLSFIGWVILAMFTCGIGSFWLTPYMQIATSYFYLQIKDEYEENSLTNSITLEQF